MKYFNSRGYNDEKCNDIFEELLLNGLIHQKLYSFPATISFPHDSILEFYASKAVYKQFNNDSYEILASEPLDMGVLQFLKDLIIDDKKLERILNNKQLSVNKNYLHSNIISIMHLRGFVFERYDLSNLYMPEAKLRYASFLGTNLENTVLTGSDLRGVNLTDVNFQNGDIRKCKLHGVSFLRSSIRSITILDNYEKIAYVGDSVFTKIWDWKKNKVTVLEGSHEKRLRKICYNNKIGYIAAGGYDNKISIWNLEGKLVDKLEIHSEPVLA